MVDNLYTEAHEAIDAAEVGEVPAEALAADAAPVKPPTMVLGVQGVQEIPVTMHAPVEQPANPEPDWNKLAQLPPFQMFAEEGIEPNRGGGYRADLHAIMFVRMKDGGQALFDQYAAWHAAKGLWPLEDAWGKLKG